MAAPTPMNFHGNETAKIMKGASSPFGTQFVADKVRRELWNFPNVAEHDSSLISAGEGTASLTELNSSEICGFVLDASTEAYGHLWVLPSEIDLEEDINFRVLWEEHGTGGAGSALFAVSYTPLTAGTTALAIGATVLDTVIVACAPSTTDYCLQWSSWGSIAGGTLSNEPGDDALALTTVVTLDTITNANIINLQVEYSRRFVG